MSTKNFASIPHLISFLSQVTLSIPLANYHAVKTGCLIIQKEAKRVLGTYDYGWTELAPFTKAERVRLGFTENDPGLRTGEMRDSILIDIARRGLLTVEGQVGSDNDKLVWFELGTRKQPPRSVLASAAMAKADEVEQAIGQTIALVFDSGGLSSLGVQFTKYNFTIR